MMEIAQRQWAKNECKLKEAIVTIPNLDELKYVDIVKLALCWILDEAEYEGGRILALDLDKIHEVDDGEYQGTLLYLIPFHEYQPNESEYLVTYVKYKSYAPHDAPQWRLRGSRDEQISQLVVMCRNIVMRTDRLYNYRWFNCDAFNQVGESQKVNVGERKWHKWPEEKPFWSGIHETYYLTVEWHGERAVVEAMYDSEVDSGWVYKLSPPRKVDEEVIAWMERENHPRPYEEK